MVQLLIELFAMVTVGVIAGPATGFLSEMNALKGTLAVMRSNGVPSRAALGFLAMYGLCE